MERLKTPDQGLTLIELIVAVTLSAVVFLAASSILVNFGKFSTNVIKSESSLMGSALGTFEQIVGDITDANTVVFPASNYPAPSIDIRLSQAGSGASSSHSTDVYHTYWLNTGKIYYSTLGNNTPPSGSGAAIAGDITALNFAYAKDSSNVDILNNIQVTLEAQAASGPQNQNSMEHLETTAVMRSRGAA